MAEALPIRIPMENVNDDSVILLAWHVADGTSVAEDQPIAEIETSKAVIELYAPESGVIRLAADAGNTLPVGSVVAYLTSSAHLSTLQELDNQDKREQLQSRQSFAPAEHPPVVSTSPDVRISRKAMELIERHGLSLTSFESQKMIREADVQAFLDARPNSESVESNQYPVLAGISLEGVSLPATYRKTEEGKLDPEFLVYVQKNQSTFAELPSALKCEEYRKYGAIIGSNVTLGHGTVILSSQLVLGDEVRIADNSTIECSERFIVGRLSSFRNALSVEASTVLVGENVFGCSRIEISGGTKNPYAFLLIGDTTFLGDDLILDVSRPILIGKEAFVTQRAIVITHNIGQSILEGFENRFEPVVLEDRCQVGMNSTIYAGSRIGNNAVIGSNSYVVSSIPAGKMAVGVPARVVRSAARTLSREQQIDLAQKMVYDFRELLHLRGYSVSEVSDGRFTLQHEGKQHQLIFTETRPVDEVTRNTDEECVIWTFNTEAPIAQNTTIFNLLAKRAEGPSGLLAESAREFLRKRGIRCEPGPWRYRGGLI